MEAYSDKELLDMNLSTEDLSNELSILLDLIPGIIHEINNCLTSAILSNELIQEELDTLRNQTGKNSINLDLIDHIEKLSLLTKTSSPRIEQIIKTLLKEEIHKLKNQCNKNNVKDLKLDHLENLINLNLKSTKRIDLIANAFRKLAFYKEDDQNVNVNEVVNASILILQERLKDRYVIREDFDDVNLVNFSFHQLNYSLICIILKIMELINTGELFFKTYETENNVHISITLKNQNISNGSLESILENNNKSKIDLYKINKLLENSGGTLYIRNNENQIESDIKQEISGDVVFDIKIKKDNSPNLDLDPQLVFNDQYNHKGTDISSLDGEKSDFVQSNDSSNIFTNPKNILIVDDESQILVSLFSLIKNQDTLNNVFIAKTAEAGLEQLKERDFSLVISDYRLPGINGIDFLNQVKEKYPNIKRALITAYPNDLLKNEKNSKDLVDIFIEKPWITEDIKALIKEIS